MAKTHLAHTAAVAAMALSAAIPSSAPAESGWGVSTPADRDSRWTVSYGAVASVSGDVKETFRAFYHATGQDSKQALAESWDLDDFGFDAPWPTLGIHFEHSWRYAALRLDFAFFELDASAKAKRDYYLGIEDDISYGGRDYGHLKIPKGSKFSSEFSGGMGNVVFALTPVSLGLGENVTLVPELDVGILAAAGDWKIDAGKARGTAVYQNPPVEFVVGGSSSSFVGAGAPFVGGGLELRVGPEDYVQWITRGGGGFFSYSGGTKPFTGSSRREKDLDVDLVALSLDTAVILPMDENTCFILGANVQWMSLDGSVKTKQKSRDAIIAARERFDKEFDVDMVVARLYAGITF